MEQHPIPQDVTGFQFKLIGTMTVKQFGFVAAGIILAVILFYLPIQGLLAIPIKLILIPLFGVSGIIIAFVPIEGRPADVMANNFIRALFTPNQYVYKRKGRQFSFSKIATVAPAVAQQQAAAAKAAEAHKKTYDSRGAKLEAFLYNSAQAQVKNKLDEKELDFYKKFSALTTPAAPAQPAAPTTAPTATAPVHADAPAPTPAPAPQMVAAPAPAVAPVQAPTPPAAPIASPTPSLETVPSPSSADGEHKTPEELGKEEAALEQQLAAAKTEETKAAPADVDNAHKKMLELEKKIQEIHQEKLQAEEELLKAKQQLELAKQEPAANPTPQTPPPAAPSAEAPHVRVVPQGAQQTVGLPHIPDTPNVVVGIVKDPRGNVLSNILVEIKDKDNNPVRAFKTNALGHFASATPLASGIYTIELEDPKKQNRFDVIQLVANNQILLPLEIISHDAREELRKQLFN